MDLERGHLNNSAQMGWRAPSDAAASYAGYGEDGRCKGHGSGRVRGSPGSGALGEYPTVCWVLSV